MHILRLAALSALVVTIAACGDDQSPDEASALYERINSENYRQWSRAPGYETRKPAASPHSDNVDIYVNDVIQKAIDDNKAIDAWPEGSIIVKDGFSGDDLELVAVMEKRADGWFWAEYFDGDSKFSGKPDTCIDCHKSGQDLVRAFPLPRP